MEHIEMRETVAVDDVRLTIITTKLCKREWELAIENEHRVRTCWDHFFKSAQAALAAGRKAIAREGAETFADVAGFEYLRDDFSPTCLSQEIKSILADGSGDALPGGIPWTVVEPRAGADAKPNRGQLVHISIPLND